MGRWGVLSGGVTAVLLVWVAPGPSWGQNRGSMEQGQPVEAQEMMAQPEWPPDLVQLTQRVRRPAAEEEEEKGPAEQAPGAEKVEPPAPERPLFQTPMNPPVGFAGPSGVRPRPIQTTNDFIPVPDRWRLGLPAWDRYPGQPGEYPYVRGRWLDPYNQNVLKGDYPIVGQNIFMNIAAISDTLVETRRLPVPSDVSSARAGSAEFFGRGEQFFINQNFILAFELFRGDTAFKPRDWELRLTPVFNINYLDTRENGIVNIDVRKGTDRTDGHVALQEASLEIHLADLSPNYDFLSIRGGIQGFTSDFRGFIFSDNELGVRLFGNFGSNRNQWNIVYFSMLEKDTNSGLNTFDSRDQNVAIANFFRQDFIWLGYTAQLSLHFNNDNASTKFDENNFLVRPALVGDARPHTINVGYLGWAGDGHIGRLNLTHAVYLALGRDDRNPIAGRSVDINAQMAAVELSYDVDWLRFKGSFLWASGDSKPTDGTARGFDSIFDNPNFAGGGFSFWNRQGIRLTQTGLNLVNRNSLLPNLRSSKEQGQANFVNPGLFLYNVGVEADLTPKLRGFFNINYLRFAETEPLELVLFQPHIRRDIGIDYGIGFQYRPLLNNNIILTLGASAFAPLDGFKDIYTSNCSGQGCGAGSEMLYSAFAGVALTY